MSERPRGCLITFEGVEGAGKSTQLRLLAAALRQQGHTVVTTAEPGGTEIGRTIRRIVMDPGGAIPAPVTELLLYLADRAQHVVEMIRPALQSGAVVLCDRFSGSTIAYQGYARDLGVERVIRWDAEVRGDVSPALTVLLNCDPEEGLRRAQGDDRLHREAPEFHRRVEAGFHELARRDPTWVTIDSRQPEADVARAVLQAVTAAGVLPSCRSPKS